MTITIPLFPLNGVIFFPNSQLPLNIFEQRYLEMVNYSLSTNRLIGMIQCKDNNQFYKIGCFGKISSFFETKDNRYIINLSGKKYFSINKELPKSKKFIIASVNLISEKNQNKKNIIKLDRNLLINKYKIYTKNKNINIDYKLIEKIDSDNLIKFLAMSCPFSTTEKQMLIETFDINELGNKIISLFDYYSNININETIN